MSNIFKLIWFDFLICSDLPFDKMTATMFYVTNVKINLFALSKFEQQKRER